MWKTFLIFFSGPYTNMDYIYYQHGWIMTCPEKCGMKSLIHPKLQRCTTEVWKWISNYTALHNGCNYIYICVIYFHRILSPWLYAQNSIQFMPTGSHKCSAHTWCMLWGHIQDVYKTNVLSSWLIYRANICCKNHTAYHVLVTAVTRVHTIEVTMIFC